ncbi:MAG: molecular chaperone TorD family protein [Planctomycetes bacterium]|nr:molecular chaperone TorD family protein [Planctomycetota bacterium]
MKSLSTRSPLSGVSAALAGLFELPRCDFVEQARVAAELAREVDAGAADRLAALACECTELSSDRLEEVFVRTFELQPFCTPYAGPHLFGEEGFQRGRMLAGLRAGFARHGFEVQGELPDHLSVLLRFAARLDGVEFDEFRAWFLATPLVKLADALAPTSNPYRHLAAAARDLFAAQGVPDHVAQALSRLGAATASGTCGGSSTWSDEP